MPLLPAILAMAAIVVASNILVQFVIAGGLLTWGAFTYPLAFLVIDLTNRLQGPRAARVVVFWGFVTGILCSLVGSRIMLDYGPAVPLRVAVASGAAFLSAQLLDVAIFQRFRQAEWWRAPLTSTFASSTLDTAVFFSLAFAAAFAPLFPAPANETVAWAQDPAPLLTFGPLAPLWLTLALADLGIKIALALVALLPYRLFLWRLQHRVSGT